MHSRKFRGCNVFSVINVNARREFSCFVLLLLFFLSLPLCMGMCVLEVIISVRAGLKAVGVCARILRILASMFVRAECLHVCTVINFSVGFSDGC